MRQARDSIVIIHTSELLYKWSTKVGTVAVWPIYAESWLSKWNNTDSSWKQKPWENSRDDSHSFCHLEWCMHTDNLFSWNVYGILTVRNDNWVNDITAISGTSEKIVPQRTRKGSSHLESSHEFKAVQAIGIFLFKGLGVLGLNMYNRFCILGEKYTIRQLQTLRPTLDLDTNSSSM